MIYIYTYLYIRLTFFSRCRTILPESYICTNDYYIAFVIFSFPRYWCVYQVVDGIGGILRSFCIRHALQINDYKYDYENSHDTHRDTLLENYTNN